MKLEILVAKIENIELADGERDEKIRDLEMKVDDLQQQDRDRNIVITGLSETVASKDDIRRVLNEKILTTLSVFDIKNVIKLPLSRNKEKANIITE